MHCTTQGTVHRQCYLVHRNAKLLNTGLGNHLAQIRECVTVSADPQTCL